MAQITSKEGREGHCNLPGKGRETTLKTAGRRKRESGTEANLSARDRPTLEQWFDGLQFLADAVIGSNPLTIPGSFYMAQGHSYKTVARGS
jgi:hypothetical protein